MRGRSARHDTQLLTDRRIPLLSVPSRAPPRLQPSTSTITTPRTEDLVLVWRLLLLTCLELVSRAFCEVVFSVIKENDSQTERMKLKQRVETDCRMCSRLLPGVWWWWSWWLT
ncbi:hypothetical protein Hamer_G004480 [Homarus americanus]|uniref:Uncharacterized protein n=1 Tax=Homarus americanus TaxID=6706 RepID=A0A8J5JYE2_HOMAM|nr:hypothetical protein Hamer_G004480 [Homarus americanus]